MELELYVPTLDELWFYQQMMSDPATMSYNAGYDPWPGYHRDTGCIDFPREEWDGWYTQWVAREPERFYAYIRRKSDGEWIGDVCFHYTPDRGWWDMGIVIYAPYRGQGYAEPALRLMLVDVRQEQQGRDEYCAAADSHAADNAGEKACCQNARPHHSIILTAAASMNAPKMRCSQSPLTFARSFAPTSPPASPPADAQSASCHTAATSVFQR